MSKNDILEPIFDVIEHGHRNGIDHGHLLVVVFEDKDHVEVLQLELDALKVHQLHVLQRDDEGRLQRKRSDVIWTWLVRARRAGRGSRISPIRSSWPSSPRWVAATPCYGTAHPGSPARGTERQTPRRCASSPPPVHQSIKSSLLNNPQKPP